MDLGRPSDHQSCHGMSDSNDRILELYGKSNVWSKQRLYNMILGIPIESQDGIKRATQSVISDLRRQKHLQRMIENRKAQERDLLERKIRDRSLKLADERRILRSHADRLARLRHLDEKQPRYTIRDLLRLSRRNSTPHVIKS